MSAPESETTPAVHRNEDPLTHEAGAHPIAAGVGAAGGGATGAAIGMVLGGPVGGVIGAVIGAVAGGLGGSAVGESIDPTVDGGALPEVEDRSVDSAESALTGEPVAAGEPLETALHGHGVGLEQSAALASVETGDLLSHDEIALQAWSIYEAEGMPDGQDLRHWLEAERTAKTRGRLKSARGGRTRRRFDLRILEAQGGVVNGPIETGDDDAAHQGGEGPDAASHEEGFPAKMPPEEFRILPNRHCKSDVDDGGEQPRDGDPQKGNGGEGEVHRRMVRVAARQDKP